MARKRKTAAEVREARALADIRAREAFMPINAATAALVELRMMDLVFRLSRRPVAEVYLDVLNGSLDELPRSRQGNCRQCGPSTGLGDLAKLPHIE